MTLVIHDHAVNASNCILSKDHIDVTRIDAFSIYGMKE